MQGYQGNQGYQGYQGHQGETPQCWKCDDVNAITFEDEYYFGTKDGANNWCTQETTNNANSPTDSINCLQGYQGYQAALACEDIIPPSGNQCDPDCVTDFYTHVNFFCNANLGDECTDIITVDGESIFNCKTSVTNCGQFYLGNHSVPCPDQIGASGQTVADGDSGEVLLYNNGGSAILEWHTYSVKEVAICEGGVTTNYKFLTLS